VGSADKGATISAQDSETVFAPNRLSLNCSAQFIARAHSDYEPGVARLRSRLGETMDTLAALPDFNLVQLTPLAGTFIQGFARAHTLSAGDLAVIFDRAANR
jgi:putative heme iron utilization protein